MANPYVTIVVFIINALDNFSNWIAKKNKIKRVKDVGKIVDTDADDKLAAELRRIADKVDERKETS